MTSYAWLILKRVDKFIRQLAFLVCESFKLQHGYSWLLLVILTMRISSRKKKRSRNLEGKLQLQKKRSVEACKYGIHWNSDSLPKLLKWLLILQRRAKQFDITQYERCLKVISARQCDTNVIPPASLWSKNALPIPAWQGLLSLRWQPEEPRAKRSIFTL